MDRKCYKLEMPSIEKLQKSSQRRNLGLSGDELEEYRECMKGLVEAYNATEEFQVAPPRAEYEGRESRRPEAGENPHNAWYVKTNIQGADAGLLSGKKIAIKDSIAVADVPMVCGSKSLEGYIPEFDATVVQRVLDAGGTIAGKATCDDLCLTRGGFDSLYGPVLNPVDTTRISGGSSSGSAALVASGEVDMAIGGDQGGSIRVPSSMCGIVGLKPTFGLIPYTGAVNSEQSIDFLGPMARSVKDVATLLQVLAGPDGKDARQPESIKVVDYISELEGDVSRMKIGLLREGFTYCEAHVNSIVHDAVDKLRSSGATVDDVSIPQHYIAEKLYCPVAYDGIMNCSVLGEANGTGALGFYSTSLGDHIRQGLKDAGKDLSNPAKLILLFGDYIKEEYGNHFYNKAQNARPMIRQAYDDMLDVYDVLIMPTLPDIAPKQPKPGIPITEYQSSVYTVPINTPHFNYTGHPALTLNAGFHENMPVGLQIVGRFWHEKTVLQVGHAIERLLAASTH